MEEMRKTRRNSLVFPDVGSRSLFPTAPPAESDMNAGIWQDRIQPSSFVNLNVGGYHFTTSIETLQRDPNSTLAALFSGRFEKIPSEDGSFSFFIDRDGTYFRFILSYLRTGKLSLPEGATFHKELLEEAEFYQIQGLIDQLKPLVSAFEASDRTRRANNEHRCCLPPCCFLFRAPVARPFEESEILTQNKHRNALKRWLPPGSISKWRLLFRASRDGFEAATFHSKCDNKGATVTIVKCDKYIFGGYTEAAWASPKKLGSAAKESKDSFLFSMVNPRGRVPTKIPPRKYGATIYYSSNLGPSFGFSELQISDNANTNVNSRSKIGYSYECPPGQDALFTGSNNFTVTDYEVFGLHK